MSKEWTLTALYQAMIDDLCQCQSEVERANCRAICAREIINKAAEIQQYRKLTPGEQSVLANI